MLAVFDNLFGDSSLWGLAVEWVVPLAAFAVVALIVLLAGRSVLGGPRREDRRLFPPQDDEAIEDSQRRIFGPLTTALAAQIPESEKERGEFRLMLRQAGIYSPHAKTAIDAARFVLLTGPLLVAGICLVLMDSQWTTTIIVTGLLVAAALSPLPRLYVYLRRRRRMQQIRAGLPDVLDVLSMCISGGMELGTSLDHVARRMTDYPECAMELLLLKRQMELSGIQRALADFNLRVDMPEAAQLTGLLMRGSALGTELVGSLTTQADQLRLMRRQTAALEANKTPVKLVFPLLFCFAPAVLILMTAPAVDQLRTFVSERVSTDALRLDVPAPTGPDRPSAPLRRPGATRQAPPGNGAPRLMPPGRNSH